MTDLSEKITIGKISFDKDKFILPGDKTIDITEIECASVNTGIFLISSLTILQKDGQKQSANFPSKFNGEMKALVSAVMSKVYNLDEENGKND